MRNTASADLLRALARDIGGPHVSLFLPRDAGDVRMQGLLRQARSTLHDYGWSDTFLPEGMHPAHERVATALFAGPGWHASFPTRSQVREQVVVAESFHIKPALPLLADIDRFFLLTLSGAGVRLFEGSTETLREVHSEELEATPEQVLAYDRLQKQREFHVAGHAGSHGRVVSHGQGIGHEVRKEHLHQYLLHVARALSSIVPTGVPLVLAGVGYLQAMFRRSWPRAIPESITGNVEHMPADELHERALACVHATTERIVASSVRAFEALRGTDLTTTRMGAALQAAMQGRVDTMWVSLDEECWGSPSDPNACEPEQRKGTEDLLNLAAARTLLSGGKVFAVPGHEVPEGGPVAATLRY